MKHCTILFLMSAVFLLPGCGGSSSPGLVTGRPAVEVEGLEPGQAVTVRLDAAAEDILVFESNGRQRFQSRMISSNAHRVFKVSEVAGSNCLFGDTDTESVSSDPKRVHRMNCSVFNGDRQNRFVIAMTDFFGVQVGTEVNPLRADRPARLRARLQENDGSPMVGMQVTFETTIGQIIPESGVTFTDEAGLVEVELRADNRGGEGVITASLLDTAEPDERTYWFFAVGDGPAPSSLVMPMTLGSAEKVETAAAVPLQMLVFPGNADLQDAYWAAADGGPLQPGDMAVLTGVRTNHDQSFTVQSDGQVAAIHDRTVSLQVVLADSQGKAPPMGTRLSVAPGGMEAVGWETCDVTGEATHTVCQFNLEHTEDGNGAPLRFKLKTSSGERYRDVAVEVR